MVFVSAGTSSPAPAWLACFQLLHLQLSGHVTYFFAGSIEAGRSHRCPLHPAQRKARYAPFELRARYLQITLPFRPQPLLVGDIFFLREAEY